MDSLVVCNLLSTSKRCSQQTTSSTSTISWRQASCSSLLNRDPNSMPQQPWITHMNIVVVLAMAYGADATCEMLLFLKLIVFSLRPVAFWASPTLDLSSSRPHANILEMSRVPESVLLSKYLPQKCSDS